MKREKFLWPLTQGHHRGLVAARNIRDRITRLSTENRKAEMAELRKEVEDFWQGELKAHFEAEEEMLQIFSKRAGSPDTDTARILREHQVMRHLLKKGFKEDLFRFAEILTAHIRFEEDVLFGRIEKTLEGGEIEALGIMFLKKAVPSCVRIPSPGLNPPDPTH
ncbi:MAG TPA: hemerythrin domain-containing protein [bacterium]|nr:hemerythrin domain-containing protein [bacterium]